MALSGELDPDAEIISRMMDRALADRETIRHQRTQIHGLIACLKASHRAQVALVTCWTRSWPPSSMSDPRISVRDRVQVLAQLEQGARWLNALAAWLGSRGVESEADVIDQAARDLLAACWMLERPLRPKPPPELWKTAGTGHNVPAQQGGDQQQQAR